jgi:ABC-type uncharacterized transport system substrate-binding protein
MQEVSMNRWHGIQVTISLLIIFFIKTGYATEPESSILPAANGAEKWRIAYYEGGSYNDYYNHLLATVQGLMKLGWIKEMPIPQADGKNARELWDWLVRQARSDYVTFLDDGFYSAGWDGNRRAFVRTSLLKRFNTQRDIDLIIAMGTWAGKDLANNHHATPTMVMSSSDPVSAGIIRSPWDTPFDHLFVHVDPYRFERQVRMFHEIVGFRTLGLAYENTVIGRSYAAIDKVEQVAREKGFQIRHCHTQSDIADQSLAERSVIRCFEQLAKQVDAIYVTAQGGISDRTIPVLVRITRENGVATLSQFDPDSVKHGFLLGISHREYTPVGQFLAASMARILYGAKPGELDPVFEEEQNISINIETANLIGLYLRADVLAAADVIYPENNPNSVSLQ